METVNILNVLLFQTFAKRVPSRDSTDHSLTRLLRTFYTLRIIFPQLPYVANETKLEPNRLVSIEDYLCIHLRLLRYRH